MPLQVSLGVYIPPPLPPAIKMINVVFPWSAFFPIKKTHRVLKTHQSDDKQLLLDMALETKPRTL